MDINSEAKKWAADNPDKTLEDAYIAGFVKHSDFVEKVNLKKEEKIAALKKKFYEELIPFVAVYGKEMVRDFYNWFSQPNSSNTNINRYMQKTWDTNLRLAQWVSRANNNNTTSFKGGSKGQDNQPPQKRRVEI
jgi:hypothetical protein